VDGDAPQLGLIREGNFANLVGIARARGPMKVANFVFRAAFSAGG
jgi:hypothetical protein